MKYIRQIHLDGSARSTAYISRIRYSYTANGPLYEQAVSDAVRALESRISDYRMLNDRTGEERPVATRMSVRGTKCIATVESDNQFDDLLALDLF
jgi:hypothetical protein